jgi:protein ImuA
MPAIKADIIAQLQKEILPLLGYKPVSKNDILDIVPWPLKKSFPNAQFPLGAMHEFICDRAEDNAAAGGFVAGLLSSVMKKGGAAIWISASRTVFPPALKNFGISPDKVIFIDLQKENEMLWAMEEALKCNGLAAVIGEMQELNFTASRRLQLAVEQSRVTGFILRRNNHNLNTTACVARWKINSLPSIMADKIPGVGFPRWNVELLKVRNGKPGSWEIEWRNGKFHHVYSVASLISEQQRKVG